MSPCLNQLSALFECIQEEAKQNEAFAKKLENIFSKGSPKRGLQKTRPAPALNPIEAETAGTLEGQLPPLSEQELKCIILAYGYRKSAQLRKATKETLIEIILKETKRLVNHGKVFQKYATIQPKKAEEHIAKGAGEGEPDAAI